MKYLKQKIHFDLDALVSIFVRVLEAKNPVTSAHSVRVGYFSAQIGRCLGMSDLECQHLRVGGVLHDIGKIGIPNAILSKPAILTDSEYQFVMKHTEIGYHMLKPVKELSVFADVARDHHLRPDGSGYPKAKNSDTQYKDFKEVSEITRIVTVADVFDILWTGRSYQERRSLIWIVNEFRDNTDKQFDSRAVGGFFKYLEHRYGKDVLEMPKIPKRKKAA